MAGKCKYAVVIVDLMAVSIACRALCNLFNGVGPISLTWPAVLPIGNVG